jgi:hypothetical protein
VEITPLMSFKHVRMLIKFSKTRKKFPKKFKLRGDISLSHLRGGLIPHPPYPLAETLQSVISLRSNLWSN